MDYRIWCYYLQLRDTSIKIARKEGTSVNDAFEAAKWNECLWGFWPESRQNKQDILRDSHESRDHNRVMMPGPLEVENESDYSLW